ncbi:hypothetical protein ACFLZD_02080 [Candidatus Neomarinimicrobiota bacterium]
MHIVTKNKIMFIIFGLFFLIFPQTAHAYLDPGTGSYIFQIILAAFVGAAFTIKIYWTKVKTFFINLFSKRS